MPSMTRLQDVFRRGLCLALAAAIVGLTPGPLAYKAMAAGGEKGEGRGLPQPVVLNVPAATAGQALNLGALNVPQLPNIPGGVNLPDLKSEGAALAGIAPVHTVGTAHSVQPGALLKPAVTAQKLNAAQSISVSNARTGINAATPEGLAPKTAAQTAAQTLQNAAKDLTGLSPQTSESQASSLGGKTFDGGFKDKTEGAVPAVAAGTEKASKNGLRKALLTTGLVGGVMIPTLGQIPATQHLQAQASNSIFNGSAFAFLGEAGKWVGNALAFIFPLPQMHKAFREATAKGTPVGPAVMLMVASLALGLINAPVAKEWFWGVQNLFGGLSIAAIPLAGLISNKLTGGQGMSNKKAFWATAALSVVVLGASALLYAAALPVMPAAVAAIMPLLPKLITAAAVGAGIAWGYKKLDKMFPATLGGASPVQRAAVLAAFGLVSVVLGMHMMMVAPVWLATIMPASMASLTVSIQWITSALYLLMYWPEIKAAAMRATGKKGAAPTSFTPLFSMLFAITSAAFLVWTAQLALASPSGSDERTKWAIYAVSQVVYIAVALNSWFFARKQQKQAQAAAPGTDLTPDADTIPLEDKDLEEVKPGDDENPIQLTEKDLTEVKPGEPENPIPLTKEKVTDVTEDMIVAEDGAPRVTDDQIIEEQTLSKTKPALPRWYKDLPADAREASGASLAKAMESAKARARSVAADARLVAVEINLSNPQGHWAFVFDSEKKGQVTVWTKRSAVQARPEGKKRPTLHGSRLAAVVGLEEAIRRLKADQPRFKPVKAEIVGTWKDAPVWRFTNAAGKTAEVSAAEFEPVAEKNITEAAGKDEKETPVTEDMIISEDGAPRVTQDQIISEEPIQKTEEMKASELPADHPAAQPGTDANPIPLTEKIEPVTEDMIISEEPLAAKAAELPRWYKDLPADFRDASGKTLAQAMEAAKARAKNLAPDARLVSADINLSNPQAHWAFVFESAKKNKQVTVWSKRSAMQKIPKGPSRPTLAGSRLASVGAMSEAISRLRAAEPRYKPARVELAGTWKSAPVFRFTDAKGKVVEVSADPNTLPTPPPAPGDPSASAPASYKKLPAAAREATGASLADAKATAQARARRLAPDAELARVAINLDNGAAKWIFIFRSKAKRSELTVYEKRIVSKRVAQKPAPVLWTSRLEEMSTLEPAYAALKKAKHWFIPVRVEIVPTWKGAPQYKFTDAAGREHMVTLAAGAGDQTQTPAPADPAPNPPADQKTEPAPPADQTPPAPPQDPPPPTDKAPPTGEGNKAEKRPHVHEDFFGFRSVKGLKPDSSLKLLSVTAGSPEIIDQISRQFSIPREKVVAMGAAVGIAEDAQAHEWHGIYRRLQRLNADQFARLDGKKYSGFRELANISYAPGWKGRLQRAAEVHKHFAGFFIRLPYHLFDMFLFGYFRRNISFEFKHSTENFLDLEKPGNAEKWLQVAVREQATKGSSSVSKWLATPSGRAFHRYAWMPLIQPLWTFLKRRVTLALLSAIAMGILGAFAPGAAFLSFNLTAIPVLGPAMVGLAHGLPLAVGGIPVIGTFLAPVVAAATMALLKDLIVGPLLNTLILTTMLTLPPSLGEVKHKLLDADPSRRVGVLQVVATAAASKDFWKSFLKANGKSFVGMVTVGAEIEGIMTYAGNVDGVFNPAWEGLTGHKFTLFHDIGSAVERPAGDSSIPFGGAITWGNALLHKAQTALGFNVSDYVMHTLNPDTKAISAQALVSAASHRPDQTVIDPKTGKAIDPKTGKEKTVGDKAIDPSEAFKFDPDLYKAPPEKVLERIKQLMGSAGDLPKEIKAVQEHKAWLDQELAKVEHRIVEVQAQSKPLTEAEKAEYARLMAELQGKRDQSYTEGKLAERHDIKNPKAEDLARLRELKALQDEYAKLLPPPSGQERPGFMDDLSVQEASLKALQEHLKAVAAGRAIEKEGMLSKIDPETEQRIRGLVDEIDQLRAEARGEMATRDAAKNLLQVANKNRNAALRERRSGKEMLEFHRNLSQLAVVMDLALSLNEINAAEKAIKEMMDLLDKKEAKINAARERNQRAEQEAQAQEQRAEEWRADADKTLKADEQTQKDIKDYSIKAGMAHERIGSFSRDLKALIDRIDAEDRGQSSSALAEYQRRLDLLPTLVQWRTNGNPNDPNAFSLKKFEDTLAEVNKNITDAEDGLAKIPTIPIEFAKATILLIPGPAVNVSNPTAAQTLQILTDRETYWNGRKADFKKDLDSINAMLDPSNTATEVDEFGDSHPKSLVVRRSQAQSDLDRAQSLTREDLAKIDAIAAQINGAVGANLPPLSGLSLEQLQDEIGNYGDKVKAITISEQQSDTMAGHEASLNRLALAKLIPDAAHQIVKWSVADATIKTIDDAMATTLPQAKAGLQGIVTMMDEILADVQADRAFINNGGDRQALLDRKQALLRDKILPRLRTAQTLVRDELIPYQRESIESAGPNGQLKELFDSQKKLKTAADELYRDTVPWSIATYGGSKGDAAGSHASVKEFRDNLQKNIAGYDDAEGHHKGIAEFQQEVANRKDPNYGGTETLYGEVQPFSLPKKIAQYNGEKAQRATHINTQAAQINEILGKIKTISKGKYNLDRFNLPTNIGTDEASVARVQAIVDNDLIPNLADELDRIGDETQGAGGDISIGTGGDGTTPVGTQPPITINDNQQLALLALEAAKRLVPTSLDQPQSAPGAYAIARYLYSDAVVKAADDGLRNQVPAAEVFLAHAMQALNGAIESTRTSDAYIDSNGTSETPDQVYARMTRTFGDLDSFLQEGVSFFNLMIQWDREKYSTIDKMSGYYGSLADVHNGGSRAGDSELTAVNKMRDALKKTFDDLEASRAKVTAWLAQLNDPHFSALRRVSESVSELQTKTRAVLETNVEWHKVTDQVKRSEEILRSDMTRLQDKQEALKAEIAKLSAAGKADQLPGDLVQRIEGLRLSRGMWAIDPGSQKDAQAIVVRKAQYTAFLDTILHMIAPPQGGNPSQDLGLIRADLLQNPQNLANIVPNAQVLDFGDNADGFYLVYQSKFSVPNGLETGSWVTLGNVAQVWGNNISVTGYQFASPPNDLASDGADNAPFGDKGVEMQIESLQGKNFVNYLNIDLHRFALDIPVDSSVKGQAQTSRLMIFDDFAMMMFGDRLYVGLAGFGDFALDDAANKPYYYGGNFKSSLKLTEVMRLNAEQQLLFAKDPRMFLQQVNLDFTGYDPDLNHTFNIEAKGDNKWYSRTQVGPSFDIARLIQNATKSSQPGDAFTVDLFFADTRGTDDINQKTVGASILKGFTIKNDEGKPIAVINNKLTGEVGEKYNTVTDRISVTLPNQGIVISGQGQLLGDAKAYYGEISKKMSDNSSISVGYGSPYVGMNNRLSIMSNNSFTLSELWGAVAKNAAEDLRGGAGLKQFNKELDDFFKGDGRPSKNMQELKRVFEQDVARKLISQDIGQLSRDVADLRKAGAFMDNTRVRAMVGFVSNSISDDLADRAVGGGFVVGTNTEMTLTKTQKELIDSKAQNLYREGLRLQTRLVELTKEWQTSVVELAQAQWDLKMAEYIVKNAPDEAVRAEGKIKSADATARLHQALLRYNALTGRSPTDPMPFDNLNAEDLESLMYEIQKTVAAPDRMSTILHSLDKVELQKQLGDNPFNLVDWIPFVDQMAVGFGAQFQDLMANQVLGVGVRLRIPVIDPHSKLADQSYVFDKQADIEQMEAAYSKQRLQAELEKGQAQTWRATADGVRPNIRQAADNLTRAVRAYRNGLISPTELRAAFDSWHWYMTTALEADGKATLAAAWAAADSELTHANLYKDGGPLRLGSLEDAFTLAVTRSHDLHELAQREQAAEAMMKANDHRIHKFWIDLHIGMNLTATGVGWLPSIGYTGIPITPIPGFEFKPGELRELQVKEGEAQTELYRQLQTKAEAGLALQLYQNVVAYRTAEAVAARYETAVIPQLDRELRAAKAEGGTVAVTAQKRYDEAVLAADRAVLARDSARATINYLLGRSADAELDVAFEPGAALAGLEALLAKRDPVAAQKGVHQARVEAARHHETIVRKNLAIDKVATEPISLAVRSLGRLVKALSDEDAGDPDKVAAARVRVLTEERARDGFETAVDAQASKLRAELDLVRADLDRLEGRTDAESLLQYEALKGRAFSLRAGILTLGFDPDGGRRREGSVPASFDELRQRLAQRSRELAGKLPDEPVLPTEPDVDTHQAASYIRLFYAKQTLGRAPIDKTFVEGWLEVRLKSPDTPPDVLLALAKLYQQKADRMYRNDQAGAASRADILLADFEMNVNLLRWSRDRAASAQDAALPEFEKQIRERLLHETAEIAALLELPQNEPLEKMMERLADLVPYEPSGQGDLQALGDQFIQQIRDTQIDHVRKTIFEGLPPEQFGNEDSLINQIRADVIAERMSYKGFTPVFAFGMFRGRPVTGGFLEAPDPREVERGLSNILTESLRKELESTGRMQTLTLRLHSLMSKVEDGAHKLELKRQLIQIAERDYKAQMGRATASGQLTNESRADVEAARVRVVDAWLSFAAQMVETKGDFITLVTELEALGNGKDTPLQPFAKPLTRDIAPMRRDREADLLDFWTDRFLDRGFEGKFDSHIAEIEARVVNTAKPEQVDAIREEFKAMRERVAHDAWLLRAAKEDAEAVNTRDFDSKERMELLALNDLEGKRLALRNDLANILPRMREHDASLKFLQDDLKEQMESSGKARESYQAAAAALHDDYWHAVPAPYGVEGAFNRLEKLDKEMKDARQMLLNDYLRDLGDDPERFLLKDIHLDLYLKAEQAFDQELIRTLQSDEVKRDKSLSWALDAMYDARGALERQIDFTRSGRGILALDALIMLEKSRMAAARWKGRSPMEIDKIAEALQTLVDVKERWRAGSTDLSPVLAVTSVDKEGKRLWTIRDWLTPQEFKDLRENGSIYEATLEDGRKAWLVKESAVRKPNPDEPQHEHDKDAPGTRYEVFGGVDVLEAERDEAARKTRDARDVKHLSERAKGYDFVLDRFVTGGPDRGLGGVSVDRLFGPDGLHQAGRVFFFAAPKPGESPAKLHEALHPMKALAMNPDDYVIMVYEGGKPLSRGSFPTLESLKYSGEAPDFYKLTMSAEGARVLVERAQRQASAERRAGWLDVKLNGYGFARDENGRVSEVYVTKDDFKAAKKSFENALKDLATAKQDRDELKAEEAKLKGEMEAAKEKARVASLEYQAVQASVMARISDKVREDFPQRADENERAWAERLKPEAEKRLVQDKIFQEAQEKFEPFSKKLNRLVEEYKHARAKAENGDADVKNAELVLARSKTWSLYESDNLALSFDRSGSVVRAGANPVYGKAELDLKLGGEASAFSVTGPIYAAVVDGDGRLKSWYDSESAVEKAASGWTIKSEVMKGEDDVASTDQKHVKTNYRLSHYEQQMEGGKSLPVLLNRRYLIERAEGAGSEQTSAKYWGLMPWRWGSLIMEIPRGVTDVPIELLTGRDPRQHHYLGRAYMYKTEGGMTERHGFFRKAIGFIDVLNILPDPVERFYDPSQFPDVVQVDSPILPGQSMVEKDARTLDGEKNVHFGVKSAKRAQRYAIEDLTAGRTRTLSRFEGGVETMLIQRVRGRDGFYDESLRTGAFGQEAVDKALRDETIRNDPRSDGSGDVFVTANPGNIAVDRVEKRVRIRPGAAHFDEEGKALDGYADLFRQRTEAAGENVISAEKLEAELQGMLDRAVGGRETLDAETAALADRVHKLAWRLHAQEALERDLLRLKNQRDELKQRLAWWESYLKRLQERRPPRPGDPGTGDPENPGKPPVDPNPEQPPVNNPPVERKADGGFWALALAGFAALSALSAAWHAKRRRRREQEAGI